MDKSKFTINPHLDSEGFPLGNVEIDNAINYTLRQRGFDGVIDQMLANRGVMSPAEWSKRNPPGWNEPGMVPITWADENPDTTSIEVKRATAEVLLRGRA